MTGWVISAKVGLVQDYGTSGSLHYFQNSGNIPRGSIVSYDLNAGSIAINVTATGGFDENPVRLGYAPE